MNRGFSKLLITIAVSSLFVFASVYGRSPFFSFVASVTEAPNPDPTTSNTGAINNAIPPAINSEAMKAALETLETLPDMKRAESDQGNGIIEAAKDNGKLDAIGGSSLPRLFIGVLSSSGPKYEGLRKAARETWMTEIPRLKEKYNVAYNFFVCRPAHDSELARKQEEENEQFRDMVFLDYEDSYALIWNKTISMYEYAAYVFNAEYLLKVDDDCFVSPVDYLLATEPLLTPNVIAGVIYFISEPIRVCCGKFTVSEEEFPDKFYPSYASGTVNLNGRNIIQFIARYARVLPKFKIDDVGVGIWLDQGKKQGLVNPSFHTLDKFLFRCEIGMMANHAESAENIRCLWENHIGNKVPCCLPPQ